MQVRGVAVTSRSIADRIAECVVVTDQRGGRRRGVVDRQLDVDGQLLNGAA